MSRLKMKESGDIFAKNCCQDEEEEFPEADYGTSDASIRRVLIEEKTQAATLGTQNKPILYDDNAVVCARNERDTDREPFHLSSVSNKDRPPFGLQLVGGSVASNQLLSSGIFVARVVPRSQAERLGLKLGDKILAVNGVPLAGGMSCIANGSFSSACFGKRGAKHREVLPLLDSNNVSDFLGVAASIVSQVSLLVTSAKDESRQQMFAEKEEGKENKIQLASSNFILRKNCREIDERGFNESDANNEFKRSTKQFRRKRDLHLMMMLDQQQQLQLQRQNRGNQETLLVCGASLW